MYIYYILYVYQGRQLISAWSKKSCLGGGYFAKASLFICRILNILVTNLNLANTQSVTIIQWPAYIHTMQDEREAEYSAYMEINYNQVIAYISPDWSE